MSKNALVSLTNAYNFSSLTISIIFQHSTVTPQYFTHAFTQKHKIHISEISQRISKLFHWFLELNDQNGGGLMTLIIFCCN